MIDMFNKSPRRYCEIHSGSLLNLSAFPYLHTATPRFPQNVTRRGRATDTPVPYAQLCYGHNTTVDTAATRHARHHPPVVCEHDHAVVTLAADDAPHALRSLPHRVERQEVLLLDAELLPQIHLLAATTARPLRYPLTHSWSHAVITHQSRTQRVRQRVLERDAKEDDHPAVVVVKVDALRHLATRHGQEDASPPSRTRRLEVGQRERRFHNVLCLHKHQLPLLMETTNASSQ
jgi:hypothetical protein